MYLGTLLAVCILCHVACDMAGDNSAIIKAHAATKPGMTDWDAIDHAERTQPADIDFRVRGKECTHAGFEAGRHNGPRYLRVMRSDANRDNSMMSRPYTEQGFATSDEFVEALRLNSELFSGCTATVFFFMRFQGWPNSDSFEVTVDTRGRITNVGAVVATVD